MSKHDDVDRVSTFFSISLIYLRMPVNVPVIADYFEEFVRDQIVPVPQQQTPFKKMSGVLSEARMWEICGNR